MHSRVMSSCQQFNLQKKFCLIFASNGLGIGKLLFLDFILWRLGDGYIEFLVEHMTHIYHWSSIHWQIM